MLVPLLITISALVSSPGGPPPLIVPDRPQIVGELYPEERVALVGQQPAVEDDRDDARAQRAEDGGDRGRPAWQEERR